MRKRFLCSVIFIIILISPLCADNTKGPIHNRNFEEKILNTSMIVNDVLDAGFSRKKLNTSQILPVFSEMDGGEAKPEKFIYDSAQKRFETRGFYVYCMASSVSLVDISFDFSPACKGTGMNGFMYSKDDPAKKQLFPVTLVCQDVNIKALPWTVKVLSPDVPGLFAKESNGKEPSAEAQVRTNVVCSDQFWLIVREQDVPDTATTSYRTEMVLTVDIK